MPATEELLAQLTDVAQEADAPLVIVCPDEVMQNPVMMRGFVAGYFYGRRDR